MKFHIAILLALVLSACTQKSPEELRRIADDAYNEVKTIPSSQPCKNLEGYQKLGAIEYENKSSFYTELTAEKISFYQVKCAQFLDAQEEEKRQKLLAQEREEQRKAELRKLGDWDTGRYVDEFGDPTDEGYIKITKKGYFSNSATTNSRLRVDMMLSDGSIRAPWFRLYEYDGSTAVKGVYSNRRMNNLTCRVKVEGEIFKLGFEQFQGSDSFSIDRKRFSGDDGLAKLQKSIQEERLAKFSCYKDNTPSTKYQFELNFKYFANASRKYELGSEW